MPKTQCSRSGVFETNSSSVHAFCYNTSHGIAPRAQVFFGLDEFGWEYSEWRDGFDYFWTDLCSNLQCGRVIVDGGGTELCNIAEAEEWIKRALGPDAGAVFFEHPDSTEGYFYVDHGSPIPLESLMASPDAFRAVFLAPSAYAPFVMTGNDNDESGEEVEAMAEELLARGDGWKAEIRVD